MKKKKVLLLAVLISVIAFIGYQLHSWNDSFNDLGVCGMSVGPCYGATIEIDMDTVSIEQYIDIPTGTFAFANLGDTLTPKLIKLDASKEVVWAVEFKEDQDCSIPHRKLSEMKLVEDEYGRRLSFFNLSYGEPGTIHLDKDDEFKYMCLSPM